MVAFTEDHLDRLRRFRLVATGSTGGYVEKTGLVVEKKKSGPLGGDAQIASDVVEGKIQAVIFLRDPLGKHPHDPDTFILMRICDVLNIPLATNTAAASMMIKALDP